MPYAERAQVKGLFLTLRTHFPGPELGCEAHTPFAIWADNLQLAFAGIEVRLHWCIKTGKNPEDWEAEIKLLDEWNYYNVIRRS